MNKRTSKAKAKVPAKATKLGYHCIIDKGRRQAPVTVTYNEDEILKRAERRQVIATATDAARNFALLGWLIRKHLDYVASFEFQARTDDEQFNRDLSGLMEEWSQGRNCDVAGRHNLRRFRRLVEACAVSHGDIAVLKLADGRMQAIEGDRIALPSGGKSKEYENATEHGLVLDEYGAVKKFAICKRSGSTLTFERWGEQENAVWRGYYTRFDQSRGISPLTAAINTFKDLYEGFDYNLVKAKFQAMLGLAIMYDSPSGGPAFPIASDSDGSSSADSIVNKFSLKPGLKLELPANARIDMLESKNPSSEFQQFSELMIRISLLALDMPYSFYDSRGATYSSKRSDLLDYLKSAQEKRADNQEFLDAVTEWKVRQWIANGMLAVPAGWTYERNIDWQWIPSGTRWIDPVKEVQAATEAIALRITSRQRICRELGENWTQIETELAEEDKRIAADGGKPPAAKDPAPRPTPEPDDDEDDPQDPE